ncbi:MAG: VCBS repeat-containing protein [Candidatus Binatia bacterium]
MRRSSSRQARTLAALVPAVLLIGTVASERPLYAEPAPTAPKALTAPRSGLLVVAPGAGLQGAVVVFTRPSGTERFRLLPYGNEFRGGIRVAVGDVNGDGSPDVVTAPGRGSSEVRIFDGATGLPLSAFFAYDPAFKGGVFVAAGDVDGDGKADIITGVGGGKGGPHVKVFSGSDGSVLRSFLAYEAAFRGGVRVAAGDVNGDGAADIITGPGKGKEGPHVKVFNGTTLALLADFYPFDPAAKNGVFVAAGDVDGDGTPDVVTGPERDGDPHVRAFSATGVPLASFFAYDRTFRSGVRVAAGDIDGDGRAEVLSAPGKGKLGPRIRIFDAATNGTSPGGEIVPFDPTFTGGVFVAAGN